MRKYFHTDLWNNSNMGQRWNQTYLWVWKEWKQIISSFARWHALIFTDWFSILQRFHCFVINLRSRQSQNDVRQSVLPAHLIVIDSASSFHILWSHSWTCYRVSLTPYLQPQSKATNASSVSSLPFTEFRFTTIGTILYITFGCALFFLFACVSIFDTPSHILSRLSSKTD